MRLDSNILIIVVSLVFLLLTNSCFKRSPQRPPTETSAEEPPPADEKPTVVPPTAPANGRNAVNKISPEAAPPVVVTLTRDVPIFELVNNLDSYSGSTVRIVGQVNEIAGGRVVVVSDPLYTQAVVLIALEDPSQPAQQATFLVGDLIVVTGQALRYDRAQVEELIEGTLTGIELADFRGEAAIVATSLSSLQANGVAGQPDNRLLHSPRPGNGVTSNGWQERAVPQTPAPILIPDARVIRLNPILYSGKIIETAGTVAEIYAVNAFLIDTLPGITNSELLVIGQAPTPLTIGSQVRLLGVVHQYDPDVIERHTNLSPTAAPLMNLVNVPFIVANRILEVSALP